MTQNRFVDHLVEIVGRRYVLTGERRTERYRQGFRAGEGEAEAVVIPGTLLELWRVLQFCVEGDRIIIMQAANTGLTAGSTPYGSYDRDVIIINTLRLDKLHVIKNGLQVISHAGGTLYKLERELKPYGRQPHSVIGSSCIGASIVGGVCNNSGGSLVKRGPAYTELSLYAQLGADGQLELVNHLGIDLGDRPDEILERLERGDFADDDIQDTKASASDKTYSSRVRDITSSRPARFNADKGRLYEASGSAGKLAVFAVRLDTFEEEQGEKVFYIGSHDPASFSQLRRRVLTEYDELPISCEYMHREAFDISRVYGKDTLLMIQWLGTSFLPLFFSLKGQLDAIFKKIPFFPDHFVDRFMQVFARLMPEALPQKLLSFRDTYEHHLIFKVNGRQVEETHALLNELFDAEQWFLCSDREAQKVMLHRFAAAGAGVRYQAVHGDEVEDMIALDIALPRNEMAWLESLPAEIEAQIVAKLYYGHFLCHVFHQDYLVKKGTDVVDLKEQLLAYLDERGAEYPAEHNVGHFYTAKPDLKSFYEELDPTNSFNPGIGKTSKQKAWL